MKKTMLALAILSVGTLAMANPGVTREVSFVQSARSAVLMPVAGKQGEYIVKLKTAEPYVSFFAERPSHVTGLISLKDYLSKWEISGDKGFKGKPPNIALESMMFDKNNQLIPVHFIGTLSDPQYNSKHAIMSYRLQVMGADNSKFTKQQRLGYTVLFIDGADVHWNPGGYGQGS